MALNALVSHSPSGSDTFNWPWFIELCVSGILVLFFLFYFNRLLATIVSFALRSYLWHAYRVWIDIQAIQISFLGGRVFFKGIRYHGENETILVHSGFVTWLYWLRSVRQADLTRYDDVQNGGVDKTEKVSLEDSSEDNSGRDEELGRVRNVDTKDSRISVHINGLEWFIYNRTPVYDAILRDASLSANTDISSGAADREEEYFTPSRADALPQKQGEKAGDSLGHIGNPGWGANGNDRGSLYSAGAASRNTADPFSEEPHVSTVQALLVRLLPVHVECSHVAVSMGNEYTRALLVTTVERAEGHIDAGGCGTHDLFRQIFDFEIKHPVIQMRPNPDFRTSQSSSAERIIEDTAKQYAGRKSWQFRLNFTRQRRRAVHGLRNLIPWFRSSVGSLHHSHGNHASRSSYAQFASLDADLVQWHGLDRYLDENEDDEHQPWTTIDYARFSTIFDSPAVQLTFYWDVPGRVLAVHRDNTAVNPRDSVNGTSAPDYGLDLAIKGGQVNYGPWADRLRAELQAMFLPASYKTPNPVTSIVPGDWRQSVNMVIRVDIEEEISLRVPTREASKDWRWRGRATAVRDGAAVRKRQEKRHFRRRRGQKGALGPDIRPFGWLSFSVAADSTVRYDMDMLAFQHGFQNELTLDLRDTVVTSSVNHNTLWRCKNQKIRCDLSNPRSWNALHQWHFDIESDSMELFLLRDHMFLLTDLISDFTAGQKSDYMTFVPFIYNLNLKFLDLRIFLNANDYNIIDDPCDLEGNTFLVLHLRDLWGKVAIPLDQFAASRSSVNFEARGNGHLEFKSSIWNTFRSFTDYENMAVLRGLRLDGAYSYCATTSPQSTDLLVMNIVGESPMIYLQGFLIRYFMNVKENYFGEDFHFRTSEEYQAALGPNHQLSTETNRSSTKKDNDLDVILTVRAEDSCAILPGNIYDRRQNIQINVMSIEADMRFTNYYMDLHVESSPVEASLDIRQDIIQQKNNADGGCQLYIDRITVFGHRLFGAPPSEPTYLCNWDFDVGDIAGECSPSFLRVLVASVQSLVFTLDDHDNALPVARLSEVYDVTLLRARTSEIRIWIVQDDTALLVDTGHIRLSLNDWANDQFSNHVKAKIPNLLVAAVDLGDARRQYEDPVSTLACLQTSVYMVVIDRKAEFRAQRSLQQDHIRFHDLRTHRADFLLQIVKVPSFSAQEKAWSYDPPAMPVPVMPLPIYQASSGHAGALNSKGGRIQRRSSFLSLSSDDSERARLHRSRQIPSACPNRYRNGARRTVDSRSRSLHNARLHNLNRAAGDMSRQRETKSERFTSPWIPPHFLMRTVVPDTADLPALEAASGWSSQKDDTLDEEYDSIPITDEKYNHAGIFCKLSRGISVFCKPAFIRLVAQLTKSMVPSDAVSIFDSFQRETISNINALVATSLPKIQDIAVDIPMIAIRFLHVGDEAPSIDTKDRYDLVARRGKLMLRISPSDAEPSRERLNPRVITMFSSIEAVSVDIVEMGSFDKRGDAGFHASIGDARTWLITREIFRSNIQIDTLEASSKGHSIERLAALIERTRAMIDTLVQHFESDNVERRAQHIIYHLINLETKLADPVFLNRPSYNLRSAHEHVRANESWKILSVLRKRLSTLSSASHDEILQHSNCKFHRQPKEARNDIITFFRRVMTPGGDPMADLPILKATFGDDQVASASSAIKADIEISAYLRQGAIIVDPGVHQSKLFVQALNLVHSQRSSVDMSKSPRAGATSQKVRRVLQAWVQQVAIDLQWELIDLVRSLLSYNNTVQAMTPAADITAQPKSHVVSNRDIVADDLFLTLGTDEASVNIVGLNLEFDARAKTLQTSVILEHTPCSIVTSVLLASTTTETRITSNQKGLFRWRLQSPNIYGAYQQEVKDSLQPNVVRLAANCETLQFKMEENIVYLLDVTSLVIQEEIRAIKEIAELVGSSSKPEAVQSGFSNTKHIDVHVALCLGEYRLRFALTPNLQYVISGEVAQTSLVPRGKSNFAVHFDAGGSSHLLFAPKTGSRNTAGVIRMPPINGKVNINISPSRVGIKAQTTVEKVIIEAPMVHACLDAAHRPQNTQFVNDIKRSLGNTQHVFESMVSRDISRTTRPRPIKNEQRLTMYSANAVFEGLGIRYETLSSSTERKATLSLLVHQTALRMSNKRGKGFSPWKRPQFELNVPRVELGIGSLIADQERNAGQFTIALRLAGSSQIGEQGVEIQNYSAVSSDAELDLFAGTATAIVDLATSLKNQIKSVENEEHHSYIRTLRRLTISHDDQTRRVTVDNDADSEGDCPMSALLDATYTLNLSNIQARWILANDIAITPNRRAEDLIFSVRKIDFETQREGSAKLTILDLQLQIIPKHQEDPVQRTANSALLPEMVFKAAHFSTKQDRRFAFQAAGKALDLRLAADGILPLSAVQRSIARAATELRGLQPNTSASTESLSTPAKSFLGNKRLASLLVDADFAGAVLTVTPREEVKQSSAFGFLKGPKRSRAGRYGRAVQVGNAEEAVLRSPGIAVKVEYKDTGNADPTLGTELKIAGSNNTLAPTVVPLILEIYSSVKEIIGDEGSTDDKSDDRSSAQKYFADNTSVDADPTAILGRVRLNAGLWIQRQEFALTCQPVAKVQAATRFDDIFITLNTVQEGDHDRFFSLLLKFNNLEASVQHVYSRESTASFEVESIVISLMNSKHVSSKNGISAILNISPMKSSVNAKQLQDFLLFREIWYPAELRYIPKPPSAERSTVESQAYAMQKYQELTTTAALPWHAIVSIQELKVEIDFGSSIGKSSFLISKLWASSKKNSESEQSLCIGFDQVGVDSSGRMSGFVELRNFHARTSIRWPQQGKSGTRAPLVQASVGFDHLRIKAAFDYQPFAMADVSTFDFLMYNVRPDTTHETDRLVAILDGGKIQAFCTSTTAGQALAIMQAFERLVQEKREAYQDSLHEVDRLMRRKSVFPPGTAVSGPVELERPLLPNQKISHLLHTDVVVALKAIDIGVFPSTFFDTQILKLEAVETQARFAVATSQGKVRSGLGMTLGQVRVALSTVSRSNTKALGEVEISEVIERATSSRGGTIMKVPRLVASMQTWQREQSHVIEYIFRSTFQGKIDIGWNYSRISFIRNMWDMHSQALTHRLGKPLPPAAVKITTGPPEGDETSAEQGKITAVVNMPQSSKYEYVALEPPVIDTPQLRDMGEATPPLEWIGLHRDKLPNVTHSIVIVTLIEVAKEVEDAYTRILGTG